MTKKEEKQCALVRTTVNSLGTHFDQIEAYLGVFRRKLIHLSSFAHSIHDDDALDTFARIIKALRNIGTEASSAAAEVFTSLGSWTSIPDNEEVEQ